MHYDKVLIRKAIGNTPIVSCMSPKLIHAKLEGLNFFGSMKDRAAWYIINKLLENGQINTETEVVESSSGNFAIALAGVCNVFGLKFTCVVDPLLNDINRLILEKYGTNIITVNEPDEQYNYLKSRLDKVQKIVSQNKNAYWINQYDNPMIPDAYHDLAIEILHDFSTVEYVFIPVSTCGTIAGLSRILKVYRPSIQIIAVDLDCSNIFQPATTKQHIPGMGLFKKPGNLKYAQIDDIVIISELDCIVECRKLLKNGIFVGASSGGVLSGINKYDSIISNTANILAVFPDRGDRYVTTVYNDNWCKLNFPPFNLR